MGYLIVFIGSGLGGMLRYAVGMLSIRVFGTNFPYGTLGINVLGSAFMGIVVGVFTTSNLTSQDAKLFLTTGVIGGFTTFSTFSLDAAVLWERGQQLAAAAYVVASVIVSLMALILTMMVVRRHL
ncbi:fluoride efflux transporter CrcB [Rhizobium sp. 57MFTsu3.2]|uniref:fluoride efflux transporter CrcB n=1 Tax=Rhizobium sp. 57MFTsu3.2 TaxID=1048681 RepID=UPI00146E53BE|nr:CrcB protein [Rhizobium sp. 57MFTsu3.2]